MQYPAKSYTTDLLSEENVKKYVLPYYGLEEGDIIQIKFKDSEKQRAVYRVDYLNKSYCLKKVYFSEGDLLFVYSAIEWLYRNGLKVPRILPTKYNSRFAIYNDMLFILTDWIEGSKCNYDNIQNVLDSCLNLARIHNATENFIPIEGSNLRTGFENLNSYLSKHFEQLLICSNSAFKYGDKFSKIFLDYFEQNMTLAELSTKVAQGIDNSNLSKAVCHLDYVNKNILFDIKNDIWIIDFDKCKIDYCIHDLSYFLRRLLKRDGTKWDMEIAVNSLKQYESLHPLTLDEYKALFVYLAFPQKYWKISRDYYNNINKCNKNSFCTLLKKNCEKTEQHYKFVEVFQEYIEDRFKISLF